MSFSCLQGVENYFTDTPLTGTKYSKAKYSRRSCMITRISYSHDDSFIHIRKRAHSQQYIRYHKLISKHKIVKLKLTLTLSLTLTDTGGAVLTLMLGMIQKFYTFIGTPEKSVHRVTIRNHSRRLAGRGGPYRRSK